MRGWRWQCIGEAESENAEKCGRSFVDYNDSGETTEESKTDFDNAEKKL